MALHTDSNWFMVSFVTEHPLYVHSSFSPTTHRILHLFLLQFVLSHLRTHRSTITPVGILPNSATLPPLAIIILRSHSMRRINSLRPTPRPLSVKITVPTSADGITTEIAFYRKPMFVTTPRYMHLTWSEEKLTMSASTLHEIRLWLANIYQSTF